MRAATAGGMSDGACGLGAGMRGEGGWDEGTDGGMACDGATGADGFTSVGVFAAAGTTSLGSTGAGGVGGFCEGVPKGAIGTGAGGAGAGSCGFCGCGSGFFSKGGNDIGAGRLTCSRRGVGCGGELALEIGNLVLERSVLPRILFRKLVQIVAQFLVLPEQNEGDKGSGDRQDCKQHKNQLGKGHWASLVCMILCSDVRTAAGQILAFCFQDYPGSNHFRIRAVK